MTGVEYKDKSIPCRLIIFDKDGILIDFTATWVPFIRKRVVFLLKRLGRKGELETSLLKAWGIQESWELSQELSNVFQAEVWVLCPCSEARI